jgi:hypothetical protein
VLGACELIHASACKRKNSNYAENIRGPPYKMELPGRPGTRNLCALLSYTIKQKQYVLLTNQRQTDVPLRLALVLGRTSDWALQPSAGFC